MPEWESSFQFPTHHNLSQYSPGPLFPIDSPFLCWIKWPKQDWFFRTVHDPIQRCFLNFHSKSSLYFSSWLIIRKYPYFVKKNPVIGKNCLNLDKRFRFFYYYFKDVTFQIFWTPFKTNRCWYLWSRNLPGEVGRIQADQRNPGIPGCRWNG